jgi:hypothetical protein
MPLDIVTKPVESHIATAAIPVPSPQPHAANNLTSLRKRDLFKRANITKFMILSKSPLIAFGALCLSALFVWREHGVVDLLLSISNRTDSSSTAEQSSITPLSRYFMIIIVGRAVLWTVFVTLFFISLLPSADRVAPWWSSAKVMRIINSQVLASVLGALFMYSVALLATTYNSEADSSQSSKSYGAETVGNYTPAADGVLEDDISYSNDDNGVEISSSDDYIGIFGRKVILLASFAFCDYVATSLSRSIFHSSPGVRTLMKQLVRNILPFGTIWFWFFCVIAITVLSANPRVDYITKTIILGWIFPFFKVVVVHFTKHAAESYNTAMKANDDIAGRSITEWVGGAEICLNLASMYGMFLSGGNYWIFLAQFLPQECIEQATAFFSHHPYVIRHKIRIKQSIQLKTKIATSPRPSLANSEYRSNAVEIKSGSLSKNSKQNAFKKPNRVAPLPSVAPTPTSMERRQTEMDSNEILQERLQVTLKRVGVEIAARESGEDISFFLAATYALPFAQETLCYTVNGSALGTASSPPTTADVLVCLFCFSLTIEHVLSVMGIMGIERKGVEVPHKFTGPTLQVMFGIGFLIMLVAAAEA